MFLTEIDPRAAVKGSRDPLGYQSIWTSFARGIIGNLTTVTGSLRNFTVLIMGLHFAERMIRDGHADEAQRADLFLKFEQLAAYSRFAKRDDEGGAERLLGIRRIRRRFNEKEALRISAHRDAHLLGDQKTYGIWGLYSSAGSESGYCRDHGLSDLGTEAMEREYLPRLTKAGAGKDGAAIKRFLEKDRVFEPKGADRALAGALASALEPKLSDWERTFYTETLVLRDRGGTDGTHGKQRELCGLLRTVNAQPGFGWNKPFDMTELTEVRKRTTAEGCDKLDHELDQIAVLEPVLAASRRLFLYLLHRDRAPLETIAADVKKVWGAGLRHVRTDDFAQLTSKLSLASDADSAGRIVQLASALAEGDFSGAVRLLLLQNAATMKLRGGAAWASLHGKQLDVRLRDEPMPLYSAKELSSAWSNSYFVNTLKAVASTVYAEAA